MKKLLLAVALVSLAACATGAGGDRTDWTCANGAAYSVRASDTRAEVFAGGRVYNLPATGGGRYTDGTVSYSSNGELAGAFGGPYNNCRRG
jgi:hypothetical protein